MSELKSKIKFLQAIDLLFTRVNDMALETDDDLKDTEHYKEFKEQYDALQGLKIKVLTELERQDLPFQKRLEYELIKKELNL